MLSVDHGPQDSEPIRGAVACDSAVPVSGPCLADDLPLAQAVLQCGPVQVTMDRGTSHRTMVYFPAGMKERVPAMPTDLDIVRCVQSRIGFAFRAALANGPPGAAEADETPFSPLHRRR